MSSREDYIDLRGEPKIYCYTTPQFSKTKWTSDSKQKGLIKVGYTKGSVFERVKGQEEATKKPVKNPFEILHEELAIKDNGEYFKDNGKGGVHEVLEKNGIKRVRGEWFECTVDDVKNAILKIKKGKDLDKNIIYDFPMRPEQKKAVELTSKYFKKNISKNTKPPHYLWNAKMRFGKTFTTYQLAKSMKWKKIMVLTYKPAVEQEWRNQLNTHIDFKDWQFFGRGDDPEKINFDKPLVWFASFQDILGKDKKGKIKKKFESAYQFNWDCIVLDEYHFGAWNENSKELYDSDYSEAQPNVEFKEERFPLNSNSFLYLTGTPFRAIQEGEFLEDQIFNWTYMDEQSEKKNWGKKPNNPYSEMPQIVMMTYEMPNEIRKIAEEGEVNEFNLNEFFRAEEVDDSFQFIHKNAVQKWLSLIRGQYISEQETSLPANKKPPFPYEDAYLLTYLKHTLWFLPNVASCIAMKNLLEEKANVFFHDFEINLAAGSQAGIGLDALPPVLNSIGDGFSTKTITLTCMKLTTGVTVPQWGGIFVLRNCSSPETYFQAAFRVQSPWFLNETNGKNKEVLKNKCYIFDFAPIRALRLIENYSTRLSLNDSETVIEKVQEFLNFLPVLQYENYSMRPIDAKELLSFAAAGIGPTMLARRWQSFTLIRVDNDTLDRLLNNKDVLDSLEKIESFRNLTKNIEKVISTEASIDKKVKENKPLTKKEKTQEKENKSFRKELREKLLKFITRIPVFMYLTDYREETLKDVIMQLERDLFTKVTGLTIQDFEKLCNIGVFNSQIMNSAIYAFRKYEEGSLNYVGGNKPNTKIGLFDTTISAKTEIT